MLAPVRTVAPEDTPVSLLEAKAHCRVDYDDDDTLIAALIDAATAHVDGWTGVLGRALVTQSWRQDFHCFGCRMRLPLRPAGSITEIAYYDRDNIQQTLSADVYQLLTDASGPFVSPQPGQVWPGSYGRADAVSVTFVAGYGDADAVPAAIKAAILLIIGHLYENREATVVGVSAQTLPMAVDALLAPYRRVGI
jgi:uncharacterized phiE125 gp8 family phage protein